MKTTRLALLATIVPLVATAGTSGQPLCLHHDSLDWLAVDSPVIVRAKLAGLAPVEGHPELSELRIDVVESIRGEIGARLRVPIETSQEGSWAKRLAGSRREVLFLLADEPRGYQEPEVRKVIGRYDPPLYYSTRIELDDPHDVFTLELETLRDGAAILKRTRELAGRPAPRPKPAPYTLRLRNGDSVTVPLDGRMEAIANRWAASRDETERHYGGMVLWGFKRQRNRPFEGGYWYAKLQSPGGDLRFGLRVDHDEAGRPYALVINGSEVIRVTDFSLEGTGIRIGFPHYDSAITATVDRDTLTMTGTWKKRSGKDDWTEMPFSASMAADHDEPPDTVEFVGKWRVKFSDSDDPAVAEFDTSNLEDPGHMDVRRFRGTVLTTTGDYRYLAGDVIDGKLELSVFDGAHAFLLRAEVAGDGGLKGDFWSRDSWHETWAATRDSGAELPDAFGLTRWAVGVELADLRFPNLDGETKSLADEEFAGKVRVITVFGSWCPNCHDSAAYLSALHKKYADRGLSVVGVAFELTGDFERDARQVRRYVERHSIGYPVLIAGVADKAAASKTLPILDRVRSFPTTIFLNAEGDVIGVHTGFSGPATGDAYEALKSKFEAIIEAHLKR